MIYFDKILTGLIGVVGWRQSTIAGARVITPANLATTSGLYVQEACRLVSVKAIEATQEDPNLSTTALNTLLSDIQKDAIKNVLGQVFTEYDVFKNSLLYKYDMDFNTTVETGKTGFAGFEIKTAKQPDLSTVLNKVMMSFSSSGTIKLLLFNAGTKTLVNSKSITVTANGNDETVLEWLLGYVVEPDSRWFVGYLINETTPRGYNRNYNLASYKSRFNECVFNPIFVDGWTSETLFDVANATYVDDTWGLNFDVTTVKDYSSIILQNRNRFAKAIQLATAVEALNIGMQTVRKNSDERMIRAEGQLTNIPEVANLYTQLGKEITNLKRLFSNRLIEIDTLR